ncbi:hypothetical protein CsSME_00016926 [Camellia sinensis var. sinensis]
MVVMTGGGHITVGAHSGLHRYQHCNAVKIHACSLILICYQTTVHMIHIHSYQHHGLTD